jgi:hypothetical protein
MSEMICPKAKECASGLRGYTRCCAVPHERNSACSLGCGPKQHKSCIPYIPEQPKKPATCHHVWLTDGEDIRCELCDEPYFTPADLKPAEPQAEMMPLIEGWAVDKRLDDFYVIAEHLEEDGDVSRSMAMRYLIKRCKLAESPAHDQQVRQAAVKEFAEKVHSFIKEAVQFVSPKTEESVLAHIRDMAEGGSHE